MGTSGGLGGDVSVTTGGNGLRGLSVGPDNGLNLPEQAAKAVYPKHVSAAKL
jgi:hypothetical protein